MLPACWCPVCNHSENSPARLHPPRVAVQGKAAAAERRAADLDSQLLLLGRALREAEGAALDWQARAGRADAARQELGGMVESNEAAVKQVGTGDR
jgi:hypothetical protein